MLQNLQNIAKFQNFQLDNLVDFEKSWKTRIYLQKSVPIQPKTSNILPKYLYREAPRAFQRSPQYEDELRYFFNKLSAAPPGEELCFF